MPNGVTPSDIVHFALLRQFRILRF